RLAVHAPGDALDRAEQVHERRHAVAAAAGLRHLLEERGGARLRQEPGLDLRHLQHGRDRRLDAHEPPPRLEAGHEIAQGGGGQGIRASGSRETISCRSLGKPRLPRGWAPRAMLVSRNPVEAKPPCPNWTKPTWSICFRARFCTTSGPTASS